MSRRILVVSGAVALALVSGGRAVARLTPEQICPAGKDIAAGKYVACRQIARSKFVKTGGTAKYNLDLSKCETKLAIKWAALESAPHASCLDTPLTQAEFRVCSTGTAPTSPPV